MSNYKNAPIEIDTGGQSGTSTAIISKNYDGYRIYAKIYFQVNMTISHTGEINEFDIVSTVVDVRKITDSDKPKKLSDCPPPTRQELEIFLEEAEQKWIELDSTEEIIGPRIGLERKRELFDAAKQAAIQFVDEYYTEHRSEITSSESLNH